jgi:hypothetical protein
VGYYYRKRYQRRSRPLTKEERKVILISLAIFVLIYLVGVIVIKIIGFIKEHSRFFISLGITLSLISMSYLVFIIHRSIKLSKEKRRLEKEEISKGNIKFTDRFGTERWGKPEEVKKWTIEDEIGKEKEKLINRIIEEIKIFSPIRQYHSEFPYQIDLTRHLKSKFPHADIEQQKGSSRPDIVIGDVAVEIKGPTGHRELDTIASKCARYKRHFGEIIIVLFEVEVIDRYYQEWKDSILDSFPNVKIIRK